MFPFRRFRHRQQSAASDAMPHGEAVQAGVQGDAPRPPAGDADARDASTESQPSAEARRQSGSAHLDANVSHVPPQPRLHGTNEAEGDTANRHDFANVGITPDDAATAGIAPEGIDSCDKRPGAHHAAGGVPALCPVVLSPEEVAFLFGGTEAAAQRSPEYRDFLLRLHGVLRNAVPTSLRGYMLFAFCLGILPVLGNQMQRATFPLWFNVLLWLTGIFVSAWLLHKGNGERVKRLARDIHAHRVPSFDTLRGCVHAVAACAIAMPSPALTLLGCILLLPPVSRSLAITLLNRVRETDFEDRITKHDTTPNDTTPDDASTEEDAVGTTKAHPTDEDAAPQGQPAKVAEPPSPAASATTSAIGS